jgi:hypothetical protein
MGDRFVLGFEDGEGASTDRSGGSVGPGELVGKLVQKFEMGSELREEEVKYRVDPKRGEI